MSGRGRASTVWGDGFVDDDWSAMAAVTDWARLHPDEYVRLFPRLVRTGVPVPDCLRLALTSVVAARSWRLRRLSGGSSNVALMSMPADEADELGRVAHADVFATRSMLGSALEWVRGVMTDRDRSWDETALQDQAALAFLDDILCKLQRRELGDADATITARFAFLAGIHPAYLWPAAAVCSERDAAAGWLGLVGRGRPALMPRDVSAYFLDVIECRKGRAVAIRDPEMAQFLTASAGLEHVWTAACLRREGTTIVVKRARAAPARWWPSVAPSGSTWATSTWSQSDRPL